MSVSQLKQFVERSRELLAAYPNGPVFQVSREELALVAASAVPVVLPSPESQPIGQLHRLHRYTITSEGASLGYFRLVEDPEGVWLTFAEVEALLIRAADAAASRPRAVEPEREKS